MTKDELKKYTKQKVREALRESTISNLPNNNFKRNFFGFDLAIGTAITASAIFALSSFIPAATFFYVGKAALVTAGAFLFAKGASTVDSHFDKRKVKVLFERIKTNTNRRDVLIKEATEANTNEKEIKSLTKKLAKDGNQLKFLIEINQEDLDQLNPQQRNSYQTLYDVAVAASTGVITFNQHLKTQRIKR